MVFISLREMPLQIIFHQTTEASTPAHKLQFLGAEWLIWSSTATSLNEVVDRHESGLNALLLPSPFEVTQQEWVVIVEECAPPPP